MSGRRKVLLRLVAAVIGLGALVWTIARLGPRRVLDLALEADAAWLVLSLVPVIARYLIWGYKWQRMLNRERRVPLRHAIRLLMAGVFVNLTTPTAKLGGGVLRAAALHKRYGFELSSAFGWVLADQMTNVLGSMLLFGALALAGGTIAPGYTIAGALGLVLFGAMIASRGWAWRAAQKPRLGRVFVRFTPARFRVVEGDRETVRWVRPLFHPLLRQTTWTDVLVSTVSFAALCASNAFVLRALGVDTPVWIVAVAVAVGYFAGNGLGPWGGIGVTEAAMAGVYLQLGVAGDAAAAGVLLHRAGYYLVGLGWGGVALLRVDRKAAEASLE